MGLTTKPGFILNRVKQIFSKNNPVIQKKIYDNFVFNRNQQKDKMCYCGHTINCDCANPSLNDFKYNLFNNNINEKDLI